jgi:hypothetical protein
MDHLRCSPLVCAPREVLVGLGRRETWPSLQAGTPSLENGRFDVFEQCPRCWAPDGCFVVWVNCLCPRDRLRRLSVAFALSLTVATRCSGGLALFKRNSTDDVVFGEREQVSPGFCSQVAARALECPLQGHGRVLLDSYAVCCAPRAHWGRRVCVGSQTWRNLVARSSIGRSRPPFKFEGLRWRAQDRCLARNRVGCLSSLSWDSTKGFPGEGPLQACGTMRIVTASFTTWSSGRNAITNGTLSAQGLRHGNLVSCACRNVVLTLTSVSCWPASYSKLVDCVALSR